MTGWWNRYPKAYEAEIAGLDSLGSPWRKDEGAFQNGLLVVDLDYKLGDGRNISLRATYPDSYPYFAPTVELPELIFPRHQNPLGKNLCLLARNGEEWSPGTDTLAALLKEQLPRLIAVVAETAESEFVKSEEDHTGEPLSNFLPYASECMIVVPDELPSAQHSCGRLVLHVRELTAGLKDPPYVNGVIRTIADLNRKPLVEFSVKTPAYTKDMTGFWLRLKDRPDIPANKQPEIVFIEMMQKGVPAFDKAVQAAKRGQIFIAGFTYQDEISWRKNDEDWVFIAVRVKLETKGARAAQFEMRFIKADWGGEQAWLNRAPDLRPLRSKSVLVVGLGSLGSPLVMQLARAGIGHVHLVDFDQLQVGNTIRWALGWRYAGCNKTRALHGQINAEYPYTTVNSHQVHLGGLSHPDLTSDYELILELIKSVDLVIDAAASHRVSHFLSDLCLETKKNYVWLTTTPGCAGGIVGRIRSGHTKGCWNCFQRGLNNGKYLLPADGGDNEIQPGGCSQPTFIGAGVDSDEVALLASRLSIATLCSESSNGYPDFEWEVAVGNFRGTKVSSAPEWKTYTLESDNSCGLCRSQ